MSLRSAPTEKSLTTEQMVNGASLDVDSVLVEFQYERALLQDARRERWHVCSRFLVCSGERIRDSEDS